MKEHYLGQLRTDEEIQDFFMVKSIAIKTGSNKKQYLDLTLGDATGEISGKKWDIPETEMPALGNIKAGDIIKVKALVTEWNGMRQLKVGKLRKTAETDAVDLIDFIKAAPERGEDMYAFIYAKAEAIKDEDLRKLCLRLLDDHRERLLYYPAAAKNHHAELAGLLYHMKRMLMSGEVLCQIYTNLNAELVTTGVIIHDIEKLNEIDADHMGMASGYSFEGQLLGHLIQGVKVIDRLAKELNIGEEKAIMLEHMILSHHYEPEFGSPKRPLFPEAEMLHYLDILDARMYDMQDALASTEPGGFSDRIWTLDNRRLYKPLEG